MTARKKFGNSEKGFALVGAIMASMILLALAILVISVSTGDLKTSRQLVGDKKALTAAERGIHRLTQTFDPQNPAASATTTTADDLAIDPASQYTIGTPSIPTAGPLFVPLTGFSIGGGQMWGQRRYNVEVTGRNTTYDTTATIGVGVGYGPIDISTMMR